MAGKVTAETANAALVGLDWLGRKKNFPVAVISTLELPFAIELIGTGVVVVHEDHPDKDIWTIKMTASGRESYPHDPYSYKVTQKFFETSLTTTEMLLSVSMLIEGLLHLNQSESSCGMLYAASVAVHTFEGF